MLFYSISKLSDGLIQLSERNSEILSWLNTLFDCSTIKNLKILFTRTLEAKQNTYEQSKTNLKKRE